MAIMYIQYDASALQSALTNGAPLELLEGTNVDTFVRAFDDTIEEFVCGKFRVPLSLIAGTVTFSVAVMAKLENTTTGVKHQFGHVALTNGEDFDVAYTNVDSGEKAVDPNQNDISIHTWTETVANLGWTAGDLVIFRYSRINTGGELPGDMLLFHLTIQLPVV